MTWILLNKRISLIIALFLCLLISLGYANSLRGQLNKAAIAQTNAVAKAIKPFEAAVKEQQDKLNQASADYETLKSERQVKTETVTREIQKIIERPIYSNICIDDDGLHKINSLITSDTS